MSNVSDRVIAKRPKISFVAHPTKGAQDMTERIKVLENELDEEYNKSAWKREDHFGEIQLLNDKIKKQACEIEKQKSDLARECGKSKRVSDERDVYKACVRTMALAENPLSSTYDSGEWVRNAQLKDMVGMLMDVGDYSGPDGDQYAVPSVEQMWDINDDLREYRKIQDDMHQKDSDDERDL